MIASDPSDTGLLAKARSASPSSTLPILTPKAPSGRKGTLGGLAGSLAFHALLALLASISLIHRAQGTGRGSSGPSGQGEGDAGAASLAFQANIREGTPFVIDPREPEPEIFGKLLPEESADPATLEKPEIPFDAFTGSEAEEPVERSPRPETDRPVARPRDAHERLPKGLPGGSGDASEGGLSAESPSDPTPRSSSAGKGSSGPGAGSGGSGDGSLVAVYCPKPAYPSAARRRNLEGVTLVEITIDAAGGVGETNIVESSGHEMLDRAALETVKTWKYERRSTGAPLLPLSERIRFVFRLGE
jgi:TonB family protein